MFSKTHHFSTFSRRNIFVWLSLAFQAGCINAGGFLALKRFVTHVTGFATLIGYEIAHEDFHAALSMATVPLFFLIGTMISAYFIDIRKQKHLQAHYSYTFFLTTFFLFMITYIGTHEAQDHPLNQLSALTEYSLLALLCLTSGIQNATVTSTYGAVIRTTHLTGPTTDLGIGFVRLLTNTHEIKSRAEEVQAIWMRVGVIFLFIIGSIASSFLFLHFGYYGFYLPFGISFLLWLNSLHILTLLKKQH